MAQTVSDFIVDKLKSATGKDFSSDFGSYQVSEHETHFRCSTATRRAATIPR